MESKETSSKQSDFLDIPKGLTGMSKAKSDVTKVKEIDYELPYKTLSQGKVEKAFDEDEYGCYQINITKYPELGEYAEKLSQG